MEKVIFELQVFASEPSIWNNDLSIGIAFSIQQNLFNTYLRMREIRLLDFVESKYKKD
jgi:hypothetical protein